MEVGALSNLTKVILSENELESLPAEFGKLTNLEELFLEGNKLNVRGIITEEFFLKKKLFFVPSTEKNFSRSLIALEIWEN